MGPWIVTSDELPDPHNLQLRCWVNGVLKQDSNTAQLMLDVAGAIAVLSHGRTLEPGDIIATGTPEGVGFARKPPEFWRRAMWWSARWKASAACATRWLRLALK